MWKMLVLVAMYIPRANYDIGATLDAKNYTVKAHERAVFINETPDTIKDVWFLLYPNAFRKGSTLYDEAAKWFGSYEKQEKNNEGYLKIQKLVIQDSSYEVSGLNTLLHLELKAPILPGDSIVASIDFEVKLSKLYSRFGHKNNYINLVHWYPKFAAYDSAGWHPIDYHVWGEFYSNFGHYRLKLRFPEGFIIGHTGKLVKGKKYQKSLDSLLSIDPETLAIQRKKAKPGTDTLEVVLEADSVHDFAVVLSPDFVPMVENLNGKEIMILSRARHIENYLKVRKEVPKILEKFSMWFGQYPYKRLTVVDGDIGRAGGGMEYPQLVIIGWGRGTRLPFSKKLTMYGLVDVIAHEVGHQWFYGILANNEMDEAWLDEAFASYAEMRYTSWRFPPDTLKKTLGFFKFMVNTNRSLMEQFREMGVYSTLNSVFNEPVLGKPAFENKSYGSTVYSKGEKILQMLELIVGDTLIDTVFHRYYEKWKFKHPTVRDFQAVCEEVSGKDLSWFFKQWLYTTDFVDFGIRKVVMTDKGVKVQVYNRGDIEMPVEIEIESSQGKSIGLLERGKRTLLFEGIKDVHRITVDPFNRIPEPDEWNNSRPRRFTVSPLMKFPESGIYTISWLPFALYFPEDGFRVWLNTWGTEGGIRHNLFVILGGISKDRKPIWSLSLSEPLDMRQKSLNISVSDNGFHRAFSLRWNATYKKTPFDPRFWWMGASLTANSVYDEQFVDTNFYDIGKYLQLTFYQGKRFSSPLITGSVRYKLTIGAGTQNWGYAKFGAQSDFRLGMSRKLSGSVSLVGVTGKLPKHEKPHFRGPLLYYMPLDMILPYRGNFAPFGKYVALFPGVAVASPRDLGDFLMYGKVSYPLKFVKLTTEAGYLHNKNSWQFAYDFGIVMSIWKIELQGVFYPWNQRGIFLRFSGRW